MNFNVFGVLEVDAISVGAIGRGIDTDIFDNDASTTIKFEVGLGTIPNMDILNSDIVTFIESQGLTKNQGKRLNQLLDVGNLCEMEGCGIKSWGNKGAYCGASRVFCTLVTRVLKFIR